MIDLEPPDLHSSEPLLGRVALITGANTGIGLVTACGLRQRGAHVFIACRSAERAKAALETINTGRGRVNAEFLPLDLGDFESIRRCAQQFLARKIPLHLLINNGGLAGSRGLTASGFELAFGTNHVGHFLLTQLLMTHIKKSAPARIITVASRAHTRVAGIDWDALRKPTKTFTGIQEYGVSKLANVLFSYELGRRLHGSGVHTYALHPGVVASDVWRSVPWPLRSLLKLNMISTVEGAATSLYCAISPEAGQETGLYYDKCRVKDVSKAGRDTRLAAELWQRSEDWVR
jgi:NAD(P)-dependent dehydrogenase (short-subunit alcohol dehydrogenase family)